MKTYSKNGPACLVFAVLIFWTGPLLKGAPVTISFEAQVSFVRDFGRILNGAVSPGTVITGAYTYDGSTPDSNPATDVGDYAFSKAPYGVTVNASNILFQTDPDNVKFALELVNNLGGSTQDNYLFRSSSNISSLPGLAVRQINWQLDDPTGIALFSDALPIIPPALASWQSVSGLRIESGSDPFSGFAISANVTKVTAGKSLLRPFVKVLPSAGELLSSQEFDLAVIVEGSQSSAAQVVNAKLNGADVTTVFRKKNASGVLNTPEGGRTFQVRDVRLGAGINTFQVTVQLPSGALIYQTTIWKVLSDSEKEKQPHF